MNAIDFRKDPTYKAKTEPELTEVPEMLFVMVDGTGAPEGSSEQATEFQNAMQALFGIVYTIKFWDKKHKTPPGYNKFSLAPVEGLWAMKDGSSEFDHKKPEDWRWTIMLRVPHFVTPEFFQEVVEACVAAKKSDVYRRARLESFTEGSAVQLMHIGPYDTEGPDIQKIHEYMTTLGYVPNGRHHELYFGDPRRTAPEKLRTILRQPVRKA